MNSIQEINSQILAKGNQMASETKEAIVKITLHRTPVITTQSSKDVPSRPWMLAGGSCVAAGIIGAVSSESNWPFYMGAIGLALLGVGFAKRNQQASSIDALDVSSSGLDSEKAFIIEKCNKIIDSKKREWDNFMASIKNEVQNLIKNSSINDEKKDDFFSFTYYPETFSLSTLPLIDKFDAIGNSNDVAEQIMKKKAEFANEVAIIIIKTANQQIENYKKISI